MRTLEKFISPLIENQFPAFTKEDGSTLISFMKAYYEWMETTGQATNLSRNLLEYRDVDTTIDAFLFHFKEKYLSNLPYVTSSNKRLLIKHINDLYRTKGTERGVQLLFRLLFDVGAEVYYPGDDILKPSNGIWLIPRYIEVSPEASNQQLIGNVVLGTTSGATAFCERLVRKRVQGKFIDVLYLSSIEGNFIYNEHVVLKTNPVIEGSPKIIGSLTNLTVVNGGRDYQVGDILTAVSGSGKLGKALVKDVTTETGRVNFAIEDGGFGYTLGATAVIARRNIGIGSVVTSNAEYDGFVQFETVVQPSAVIDYTTANTSAFIAGTVVENYYGNGVVSANALIVASNPTNSTSGSITIVPGVGNIASDATISISGNTANALIVSYTDTTVSGNVMYTSNTTLGVHNISITHDFISYPGNYLYGTTSNTHAYARFVSSGAGATFSVGRLTNEENVLIYSDMLRARNTGNVAFMDVLLDGSNSNVASNGYGFVKYPAGDVNTTLQNVLRGGIKTIGEIAGLTRINPGIEYNADPFVLVLEQEVAGLDKRDYALKIANLSGLFVPGEVVEISSNSIGQQLSLSSFSGLAANGDVTSAPEVGELIWQNDGTSNTAQGFVYQVQMYGGTGNIVVANTTGTFSSAYGINTLTTNATSVVSNVVSTTIKTTAIGSVKTSNTTVLNVKRLSLMNDFIPGYTVLGKITGATATITDAAEDETTAAVGINAIISANVQVANTVVSRLQVLDSGFGYVDNELLTLSGSNNDFAVTARVSLETDGHSEGYYQTEHGFLDASSKIHDGDYYQEFSYEVQSRIPISKYADALKQIVHTAGTQFFGKVIFTTVGDTTENTIALQNREHELNIASGDGIFNIGNIISQTVGSNTSTGTLRGKTGTITIANANPNIEFGRLMSSPDFSSNTKTANVAFVSSNSTHSTLYIDAVAGTIDSGDVFEAVVGRTLSINEINQGNTVTGSFQVGETVYQSITPFGSTHTANGIVVAANNTHVDINTISGIWLANTTVYGYASNAYANAAIISDLTDTFTSITSINTLHISNTSGQYVDGVGVTAQATGATADVTYVTITLDT